MENNRKTKFEISNLPVRKVKEIIGTAYHDNIGCVIGTEGTIGKEVVSHCVIAKCMKSVENKTNIIIHTCTNRYFNNPQELELC